MGAGAKTESHLTVALKEKPNRATRDPSSTSKCVNDRLSRWPRPRTASQAGSRIHYYLVSNRKEGGRRLLTLEVDHLHLQVTTHGWAL